MIRTLWNDWVITEKHTLTFMPNKKGWLKCLDSYINKDKGVHGRYEAGRNENEKVESKKQK